MLSCKSAIHPCWYSVQTSFPSLHLKYPRSSAVPLRQALFEYIYILFSYLFLLYFPDFRNMYNGDMLAAVNTIFSLFGIPVSQQPQKRVMRWNICTQYEPAPSQILRNIKYLHNICYEFAYAMCTMNVGRGRALCVYMNPLI